MKPQPSLAPILLAWLALSACASGDPAAERRSAMPQPLPDISALAWLKDDQFLAVHDAKGASDRPRLSLIELPRSGGGTMATPLQLSWPASQRPGSDLESIAPIPGTPFILIAESGSDERNDTPSKRIFLFERNERRLALVEVVDWPLAVSNVEGTAVARIGTQLVFLFAERAHGQPNTLLRWAALSLRPLAFGPFQEAALRVADPSGPDARPVSAIEIDDGGRIYIASAVDSGNDNGPFRSVLWRIGRIEAGADGRPRIVLEPAPQRLAVLDGVKVEGLAVRRGADGDPEIFIGTDDENYGGIVRLVDSAERR